MKRAPRACPFTVFLIWSSDNGFSTSEKERIESFLFLSEGFAGAHFHLRSDRAGFSCEHCRMNPAFLADCAAMVEGQTRAAGFDDPEALMREAVDLEFLSREVLAREFLAREFLGRDAVIP